MIFAVFDVSLAVHRRTILKSIQLVLNELHIFGDFVVLMVL